MFLLPNKIITAIDNEKITEQSNIIYHHVSSRRNCGQSTTLDNAYSSSSKGFELPLLLELGYLLLIFCEPLAQIVQILHPLLFQLVVVEILQFGNLFLLVTTPGRFRGRVLAID